MNEWKKLCERFDEFRVMNVRPSCMMTADEFDKIRAVVEGLEAQPDLYRDVVIALKNLGISYETE